MMETYGHQGNFNWSSWNSFRPKFKKLAFVRTFSLSCMAEFLMKIFEWEHFLNFFFFVACPSLDQSSKNMNVTWRSWGNCSLQWSKTLYHYMLRHHTKKFEIFFIWKIGQRHNSDCLFISKRDDWYKVNPNLHGGRGGQILPAPSLTFLLLLKWKN